MYRTLGSGSAALRVSSQGFGCMGMTAFYGTPMSDTDGIALIQHAFQSGITHFDTAEVYQGKDNHNNTLYNEHIVGKGIAAIGIAKRNEIQIATKYMPRLHKPDDQMTSQMVVDACRESCQRLGVDYVDLYYVHRLHPTVPVEQQAEAMNAVKAAGLAKHIGVSEFSPKNLKAFHSICPVTCIQQEWSLMNRDLEEDLVPLCRELGIGIVAYSPLCRKLLSGDLKSVNDLQEGDLRASRYGRLEPGNLSANSVLVDKVAAMAKEKGLTAAQLSLNWVQSQGIDVCPIPGTTSIAHLSDNVAAMKVAMLSQEECNVVAALVPKEEVHGNRYAGNDAKRGTYKSNM